MIQIDPLSASVALLACLIAAGLGIWANVVARRANAISEKANTISRDAVTAAQHSAAEAKRASDAAEAANELAHQERARALETHDVAWQIAEHNDVITITNVGTSMARSVTAVVRVGSVRFDVEPGDVDSDGSFECDASAAYQEMREENARAVRAMDASGIAYFPSYSLEVEARVSWQSEHGTPGIQVVADKL